MTYDILKGFEFPFNEYIYVVEESGTYQALDFVLCRSKPEPEGTKSCQFLAQYIVTGIQP